MSANLKSSHSPVCEDRVAAALRENLRKRKQQGHERAMKSETDGEARKEIYEYANLRTLNG